MEQRGASYPPTGEGGLKSDRKSHDTPGGTETVLVVEDEVLSQSAPGLDVLLTDIVLSGVARGWEVAESIGARYPGIAVVFMSGYTSEHMMSRGEMGADVEVLDKPFTPGRLMAKMREVLDDAARKRTSTDTDRERLE